MDTPGVHFSEVEQTEDEAPAQRRRGWHPGQSASSADPTVFATEAPAAASSTVAEPPVAAATGGGEAASEVEAHPPEQEEQPEQPLVEGMTTGDEEAEVEQQDEHLQMEDGEEGQEGQEGGHPAEEERPLEVDEEVEDVEEVVEEQDFGSAEEGWEEVECPPEARLADAGAEPTNPAEAAGVADSASSVGSGGTKRRLRQKTNTGY